MKKTVFFMILVIVLLSIMLTGCQNSEPPQTDVWDGSVATAFESGDGTKNDPYVIKTAAQLAFLATEVNSGADYNGKYVSMESNLDLNHLEWTPIGNGTYSFNGIFDGNGLSIKNLKITNGVYYNGTNAMGEQAQYTTGLFGSCLNSIIKNISIDHADITITNVSDRRTIIAGILVGEAVADTHMEISNIKIINARVSGNYVLEKNATSLAIGGICGYARGDADASCTISRVQSEISVSIKEGQAIDNYIGGLSGLFIMQNTSQIENCASYLSVEVDPAKCYNTTNYFGAFGEISTRYDEFTMTSIFSKISVNKINENLFELYPAYTASVITASINPAVSEKGKYKFENIFGFIDQVDETTGLRVISTQLHDIPYPDIYTETNCQGCETLPEHHGFDQEVWDLSDLSYPKIN